MLIKQHQLFSFLRNKEVLRICRLQPINQHTLCKNDYWNIKSTVRLGTNGVGGVTHFNANVNVTWHICKDTIDYRDLLEMTHGEKCKISKKDLSEENSGDYY